MPERLNRPIYSYEDDKCTKAEENKMLGGHTIHYSTIQRLWVIEFLSESGPSPYSNSHHQASFMKVRLTHFKHLDVVLNLFACNSNI